ncbi:hypothetical protein TI39_contig395g00001 [Zymoseptoria brevis]|uniref:Uncharacterized protein n=1 Tax=Zymoseptoria brevis TaxID=1047168 RepID=A0A0F4GNS8_9PEZI|nr:hypothetical protein TI39_contig395g00001 [Zymoseptoria brevis]
MVLIHHSSAPPAPGSKPFNPPQDPDMPSDRYLAKQQRKEERRRAVEREIRREAEDHRASVALEQLRNARFIRSGGISFRMSPLPAFPELKRAIKTQEYHYRLHEPAADDARNAHPAFGAPGAQLATTSRVPSSRQDIKSSIHISGAHRQDGRQSRHHIYRQEYLPGRAVRVEGTQRPQEYLHHIHHGLLKRPRPTPILYSGSHHRDPRSTYGTVKDQHHNPYGTRNERANQHFTASRDHPSSRDPLFERHERLSAHRRGGLQGYTFQPDSQVTNAFSIDPSKSRESHLRSHDRSSPHHGALLDGYQNFVFVRSDSRESHHRRQDRRSFDYSSTRGDAHDARRSNTSQRPSSGDLSTTLGHFPIRLSPTSQPSMAWISDHPFRDAATTQNDHTRQLAGPQGSRAHYAHVSLEPFDRFANHSPAQQKANYARPLHHSTEPHRPLPALHDHSSYDQSYLNDFNRPRHGPADVSETMHKRNRQVNVQSTSEYDAVWPTASSLDQYSPRDSPINLSQSELQSLMHRCRELDGGHLASSPRGTSDGDSDLGSGSTVTLDGDEGSSTMADGYENVFGEENARMRNDYTGHGRGNSWSEAKGRFGL